ncbi:hypothetical protein Tco_1415138, partial [Tanacetum coccineum]
MTLYNALPRKEYKQVFVCKTAKEIWYTLIITHQGNTQVKDCNIDLLIQQYEKFLISSEETIDSGFTRFNAIRAKITVIEEAKDLATLPLDELIDNLKVYEMVLENDGIVSKTIKEKVMPVALKAKVTRGQISSNSISKGEQAFVKGAWSDSEDGHEGRNMSHGNRLSRAYKEKRSLESKQSRLLNKINDLELEVKELTNNKEVVEPCQKCDVLTQEVDSLNSNVSKLQDEALNFSKFKKSSIALDDMLSRQKFSQDKEGLSFLKMRKSLP